MIVVRQALNQLTPLTVFHRASISLEGLLNIRANLSSAVAVFSLQRDTKCVLVESAIDRDS
jgi:hypothetical protein